VQRAIDERLAAFAPLGTRVAILSRAGVTAPRKNWEEAQARRFAGDLRRRDPRWRVISMDGDDFEGVADFRALFGDLPIPFATAFKALLRRSELLAGVPAGPLHLAMSSNLLAVVGIWRAHHPDWYDEPNARAIHVVGRIVRERKFHLRPATTTKPPSLQHRLSYVDEREIPAEAVAAAAIDLTG
jgi:ADP-heptose:LPS heptosyltransferase